MAKRKKGFTQKSLKKLAKLFNQFLKNYENVATEDIPMCISNGNVKIGRVMNVSLAPILSCGNCSECQFWCYDIKACLQYTKTVVDARIRNWVIFIRDRDEFFRRIEDKLRRRRKNKYFRWHVAGDIVDLDHFIRMVEVAKNHPDFIFWTYTKMYAIVNEFCDKYGKETIPSNFSVMFSEWRGLPMDNPYGFAEFRVRFDGEPEPPCYHCPGNCDVCKKGNRGCLGQETTYNDIH